MRTSIHVIDASTLAKRGGKPGRPMQAGTRAARAAGAATSTNAPAHAHAGRAVDGTAGAGKVAESEGASKLPKNNDESSKLG